MIQWSAPDPASEEYAKAIVDYIKGGKPMDEFAGFKLLARQIHPQTGEGVLLVEASLVTVCALLFEVLSAWAAGVGVGFGRRFRFRV